MIYKPYNVEPNNTCIDATKDNVFWFTFSGDKLGYRTYQVYDAETGESLGRSYVMRKSTKIYNNDRVPVKIGKNTYTNGKKYKYSINIYQDNADIFVMQGKIRDIPEASLSDNQIPITYGITEIESAIYYNGTLFGGCYMEVTFPNGTKQTRLIKTYDPSIKYGNDDGYNNYDWRTFVTLETPFTNKPTSGMTYRIYKNYITTPEYYFECASTPVIEPSINFTAYGCFNCTATYTQAEDIPVKYYQYKLYKSVISKTMVSTTIAESEDINNFNIPLVIESGTSVTVHNGYYLKITDGDTTEIRKISSYDYINNIVTVSEGFSFVPSAGSEAVVFVGSITLIDESDKIYSSALDYVFNDVLKDVDYNLSLYVTTQNNMTVEKTITGHFSSVTDTKDLNIECYFDESKNIIKLKYNTLKKPVVVRRDVVTNEEVRMCWESDPIFDYLCAANKHYKYKIINMANTDNGYGYGKEYETEIITPKWDCWNIYSLVRLGYNTESPNKENYNVGEQWKLYANVEEGDKTQILNHNLQTNYAAKPRIVMNDNNYITGSITCCLANIECVDGDVEFKDDIYMVESWRKFISESELYLLKNPKGDVWIVSITDNPTTNYDYSNEYMPTTISFNFTECRNLDDIIISNSGVSIDVLGANT